MPGDEEIAATGMNKPRQQRLEWLFTSFPVYFLTACTHARQAILANETTHNSFFNFAKRASEREVMVGRYVIMPDHLHLFAALGPQSPDLSEWAKALKGTLSKDFREAGMRVPYWQKGFFDHVMRSEESYEQKWAYVLWGSPDAEEKRKLGELWAERSGGSCLFIVPKGKDWQAIEALLQIPPRSGALF